MASLVNIWWVWIAFGLALAVVEVLAPGFIFLGFALGAVAMALIVLVSAPLDASLALALFGGLSLIAWIALRVIFRNQRSGARFIKHDIND